MAENHELEILEETLDGIFDANGKRIKQLRLGTAAEQNFDSVGDAFKKLVFSKSGPGDLANILLNPIDAWSGKNLPDEARRMAQNRFSSGLHNGPGDAFRHAYWSFRMSQENGPNSAKRFGDAHERKSAHHYERFSLNRNGAPIDETVMDLYNNHMGRKLFQETPNAGQMSPDDVAEVILKAQRAGRLQERPVRNYR